MITVRLDSILAAAILAASLVSAGVYAQGQPAQSTPEQAAPQAAAPESAAPRISFTELSQQVRQLREEETRLSQQREATFNTRLREQEQLARETLARRDAAEARSNALDRQWQDNEARIAELSELLRQHEGNLGELFGVTRQVAGDAATVLQQSLLTTRYPPGANGEERAEFMRRLAGARALPSITELERLWFELLREMTDSGKVVRFNSGVLQTDNTTVVDKEIVAVGSFTAVSDGEYLGYLPSEKALASLNGQLATPFRAIGQRLQGAPADSGYTTAVVDPARGALLGLYVQRPNLIQRINEGEVVGYVIVAVGILGVLLALYQAVYLIMTRLAVSAQLRDLTRPKANNPLGRVLLAFRGDGNRIENVELAELRISEAVLREVPKLERFQSFLRLAVAAGPLLGLIGTVIGMIITFKAITASGSSDPKLMAHGIGQAMIATVLGLGIAIPLLFINAGLAVLSRGVTQTLDEQSQVLLAETVGSKQTA